MVRRGHLGERSRIALAALASALLVGAFLAWSCRDRGATGAQADNRPGATTGALLVICTGNTQAALETCH